MKKNNLYLKNKKYKNWNLIISIPPCKFCKSEIDKFEIFNNIFYLFNYEQNYKFEKENYDLKIYKKFIHQTDIQKNVILELEKQFISFHKKNY